MKHLFVFVLLTLCLSACMGASATGGQTCQEGICINMQLTEPLGLNLPVPALITVQTEREVPGLKIFFPSSSRAVLVEGDQQWTVNVQSRKSMATKRIIRFSEEGLFEVMAYAQDPLTGTVVKTYVIVHITQAGGKIYLPGTPIPITPDRLPTITPGPSPSPAPGARTSVPTPPPQPFSTPAMQPYP